MKISSVSCPLLPLGDLIVVQPDPPPEKIGSLVVALRAQKPTFRGTVVAVGPGLEDEDGDWVPCELNVGDRICHSHYNVTVVSVGATDWLLLRERDVLCRI